MLKLMQAAPFQLNRGLESKAIKKWSHILNISAQKILVIRIYLQYILSSEQFLTNQVLQQHQDSPPDILLGLAALDRKQLQPTEKKHLDVFLLAGNNMNNKASVTDHLTACLTFFPVLMLIILTFSLPVRALSALLLLFLLLLFTRS